MTYDWNSFYGTFAQVAAGLIGILAAFFISRFLSIQEKYIATTDTLKLYLSELEALKLRAQDRRYDWVNIMRFNRMFELKPDIREGKYKNMTDAEIILKLYNDHPLYRNDQQILSEFREAEKDTKVLYVVRRHLDTESDFSSEVERINEIKVSALMMADRIKNMAPEFASLGRSIKPLKTFCLFLLLVFPILVVYPIHFLPIPSNVEPSISFAAIIPYWTSLKAVFLLIFLAVFEIGFLSFYASVRRLERGCLQRLIPELPLREGLKDIHPCLERMPETMDEIRLQN